MLQPQVLTAKDLTLGGADNRGFLQPGVFRGVPRTRGFTTKGYYNQGFLKPGVLHSGILQPGVLTTRGLASRALTTGGSYNQGLTTKGLGCYKQGTYIQVFLQVGLLT